MFGSWVTRVLTASHFDHIALVMRFGDSINDLYILEAVGEKGVRMVSWNNLRK
jgi:phosphoserine phosphatase